MARIKRGVTSHRRHKKVLRQAKGYYGNRSKIYRVANQAVMRSCVTLMRTENCVNVISANCGLLVSMQHAE